MSTFTVLIRKELLEQWRTRKLIIISAVLLIFGMFSPLIAKLTPDLINSIDLGFEINLPEPTYQDAYMQYFKNITQICLLVVLVVFSGFISEEISRGTVVLLLSKGLSRRTFVFAKFFTSILLWSATFFLSAITCYGYIEYLFPNQNPQNLILSLISLWLFGVFLLSLLTLGNMIGHSSYLAVVFTLSIWGLLALLNIFPEFIKYSPLALSSWNMEMILGEKDLIDLLLPFIVTGILIIICLTSTMIVFSKQEM